MECCLHINITIMPRQVILSLAWWHIPVVPVHRRLRQEDYKFKNSLGAIARLCLHTNKGNELKSMIEVSFSPSE